MKKEKINLTTIFVRVLAETPAFWKKIQKVALSLGISCVAVLVANGQLGLDLPDGLLTAIKYSIAVFAAITGTAQMTKEDK